MIMPSCFSIFFIVEYIHDCLSSDTVSLFSLLQRCYWSDMFTGRLRSEIPPALVMHFFLNIIVLVTSLGFQTEFVVCFWYADLLILTFILFLSLHVM